MNKIMQIYVNFLRVLFVLSTIVFMTDCCSSKIMLLKEQIVYHKQQQQQKDLELQINMQLPDQFDTLVSQTEKIQYIPKQLENTTEMNFGKIANSSGTSDTIPNILYVGNDNDDDVNNGQEHVILYSTLFEMSTTVPSIITESKSNYTEDNISTSKDRDAHKFDMLDIYYTIMRDVLSFECNGEYLTDFCLNRGRCFRYPVGNHSFFSCECADGFVGERCESKSLNGYYVPHRGKRSTNKILTARVFFSFPILIVISLFHVVIGLLVILRNSKTYHHRQRSMDDDNSVTFNSHHLRGNDAATVTAVIG